MIAAEVGQVWKRGRETRTITRVTDGYVEAACTGNSQRDRVICLRSQWAKWSAKAVCVTAAR